MGVPDTWHATQCFRGGEAGRLLYVLSTFYPWYIILEFTSRARAGHRIAGLYLFIQSLFFVLVWLLGYVLRDHVFREPPPYPECGDARFTLPSIDMLLAVTALTVIWLHKLYFGAPYRGWFKHVGITALVYGTQVWSGNYRHRDELVGAALGVLIGACFSLVMYAVVLPLAPFLYAEWWTWWTLVNGYESRYRAAHDSYRALHNDAKPGRMAQPPGLGERLAARLFRPADVAHALLDAETLSSDANPFYSAADWAPTGS